MVSEMALKETLTGLDSYLVEMVNKYRMAGLAVGVVHEGALVYTQALGFANIEEAKPISMDTTFRIASISKTFTAIGLMQLWEQGKFKLDDPVNDYLKELKVMHPDPYAPAITFRHMLTHTSGIGEAPSIKDAVLMLAGRDRGFIKSEEQRPPLSDFYGGLLITDVPAGQKWAYANHAYAILGKLVEDISGSPFPQYMLENVFKPLGMFKTDYRFSERVNATFAQGYAFKKCGFEPVSLKLRLLMGAGSVFSSVNDMALYLAALMNGGANEHGRVIKPETLKMMMTPQLDTDPRVFGMGLAFWLERFGETQVAGHGGSLPGFISDMKVAPEEGLGVVVFTNTASMGPEFIGAEIMYRLLGVPNPDADFPPQDIIAQPHAWEKLTGFYGPKPGFLTNARLWFTFGGEVEVFVNKQNQLAMRGLVGPTTKGFPIYRVDPEDPMRYRGHLKGGLLDGFPVQVHFEQNHEGGIDRVFVMQNRMYRRPKTQSLRFKRNAVLSALVSTAASFLITRTLRKRRKNKQQ